MIRNTVLDKDFFVCLRQQTISHLNSESSSRRNETYPSERHHVESVGTTIELIKEVAVDVLRCVVYLQLSAWIPVEESQRNLSDTDNVLYS